MDTQIAWVIGGPGSGKTTQSQKIAQQYGYVHIDPSIFIKKEVDNQAEKARASKVLRQRDIQVPLIDIIPVIAARVSGAKTKGVVIDGYPGSLEEAAVLERGLGQPDIVIALEVDEETSSRRSIETKQIVQRPTLSEYLVASRDVIQKYKDITAKVDSSREPLRVFEVIQFNIDALRIAEENLAKARRFNSLGPHRGTE